MTGAFNGEEGEDDADVLENSASGGLDHARAVVAVPRPAVGSGDEPGSKRTLAGIIFGLGMAMGAANFLAWLF